MKKCINTKINKLAKSLISDEVINEHWIELSYHQKLVILGLLNLSIRTFENLDTLFNNESLAEVFTTLERPAFEQLVNLQNFLKNGLKDNVLAKAFLVEGVKGDVELLDYIKGDNSVIANNVREGIEKRLRECKLSESEVKSLRNGPEKYQNLHNILGLLDFDKADYLYAQRLGAQYIHGTTAAILDHAVEIEGDKISAYRGDIVHSKIRYLRLTKIFLDTLGLFLQLVIKDDFSNAYIEDFGSLQLRLLDQF